MTPDLEAFVKRFFWWVPRRPAFYLSAVWVGSQIGAYAVAVGLYLSGAKPYEIMKLLLLSPVLYGSVWMRLNVIVMVFAMYKFADMDNLDFRNWAIFTGILGLLAMLGGIFWVKGPLAVTVTWALWLGLTAGLVYAVWFFEHLERNRWAGELAMLKADNAERAARRGTLISPEEGEEG